MRTSNSYIATIDPNSVNDIMIELKIRDTLATINQMQRVGGQNPYYLKKQGRLGKNNPHAHLYRNKKSCTAYQTIKLEHAAYYDLYLYERKEG